MLKKFVFYLAFMSISLLYAQPNAVKGRIWDAKTLAPILDAEIRLINLKDSAGQLAYSDSSGRFMFREVKNGTYEISNYTIGYKTEKKIIEVKGDNPKGTRVEFALQTEDLSLKEITITGKAPIAMQKGDTTQFNASAFKVQPNASAEDLVTKIPGVTMQNGTVTAQGENVKQVLVDGRPFFGEDPNAVLKNLPAEMIDKVQVYDRNSNQGSFTGFEDANTSKIMNIVTKIPFRNGTFGKAYAGAGYGDEVRAKAGGNLNVFNGDKRTSIVGMGNNVNEQNFSPEDLIGVFASNMGGGRNGGGGGGGGRPPMPTGGMRPPGGGGGGMMRGMEAGANFLVGQQNGISTVGSLGFNHSQKLGKKWEFAGSLFTNLIGNENASNTNRQYTLPSANGLIYQENSATSLHNQSVRSNLRFTFNPDSMNNFIFNPKISYQRAVNDYTNQGLTLNNTSNLSATNNSNLLKPQSAWNIGGDFNYSHRFPKKGRTFSIEATGSHAPTTANRDISTRNISYTDSLSKDSTLQNWQTKQWAYNLSSTFTYTEPISEKWAAMVTYNPTFTRSYANRQAYNQDFENQSIKHLDTAMTNLFYTQYLTQNGGLGLRYQYKLGSINFGTNYQYSTLSNDQTFPTAYQLYRSFQNVLPYFFARLNIDKQKSLRIRYSTRTNAPSVTQLQPIINNSNPLQLSSGNANLSQEYRHNLVLRYTKSNPQVSSNFFAMMMGNYTQNYIGTSTFIATKDTVIQGNTLATGSQYSQPINLDGYISANAMVGYTFVVSPIKSNLTISPSINYSRTPGLINGQRNEVHNPNVALGLMLNSNISEKIDFSINSNSSFNLALNTLQTSSNNFYFIQNTMGKVNFLFKKGFILQTDLTHQLYSGLSSSYNKNFFLWNAAIGKKFGKNQNYELKAYVFDILKQNNSIQRSVTETYLEDTQTKVLRRYAMLIFTYNFKKAGNQGGKK